MLRVSRFLQILAWVLVAVILFLGLVTLWLRRNLDSFPCETAEVERVQAACRTYLHHEFDIDFQPPPSADAPAMGVAYLRDSEGNWTLHDEVQTASGSRRYICFALENGTPLRVVGIQWRD